MTKRSPKMISEEEYRHQLSASPHRKTAFGAFLFSKLVSQALLNWAAFFPMIFMIQKLIKQCGYRKTPLISTYVFSGLATEQVLIFGAVLTFGGMIRRRQKSCKEGVCSIQCFPHTTRYCGCFSDYVHTSRIQGYLYSGGGGGVCTFGALQPTANFSKN